MRRSPPFFDSLPPGPIRPASRPPRSNGILSSIGADAAWTLGYLGAGVVVGGGDTGYQWQHPALIGQYRGWNGTQANHDYDWHDAIHSARLELWP